MKKVAVIAAHPDDEALGCGGTLVKCKQSGDEISLLFMTDGISARDNTTSQAHSLRKQGIQNALDMISPHYYQFLDFPDNQLDSIPLLEIVKKVKHFLAQTQPDIVLTHFYNDLNIDHAITCRAVLTAARPGSAPSIKQILSFEIPSSTEWAIGQGSFRPDSYVDISAVIEDKMALVKCYETEIRPYPHPRSLENIRALAQMRGAQNALPHAEAFMTLRRVLNEW